MNQIDRLLEISDITSNVKKTEVCLFIENNELFFRESIYRFGADKFNKLILKISKTEASEKNSDSSFNKIKSIMNETLRFRPTAPPAEDESIGISIPYEVQETENSPVIGGMFALPPHPSCDMKSPLLSDRQWSDIKRERFESYNPRWYEVENIRVMATRIFTALAIGEGIGSVAVGAGFIFSASPWSVMGVTIGLAIFSICSAVAAFFSHTEGSSFLKDPDYLIKAGKQAEKDIVDNHLPFTTIESK